MPIGALIGGGLGIASSLLGNRSKKKAARASNRLSQQYSDKAHGELDRFESGYGDLANAYEARGQEVQGDLNSLQATEGFNTDMIRQYIDQAIKAANMERTRGQQAAQAAHDQQVGSGTAQVTAGMRSRGLGGTTLRDNAELAVRGNAAGGLAMSHAYLEDARARGMTEAGMQGAGLLTSRFGQTESAAANRMSAVHGYGNTALGLRGQAIDFRANNMIRPELLYPQMQQHASPGFLGTAANVAGSMLSQEYGARLSQNPNSGIMGGIESIFRKK